MNTKIYRRGDYCEGKNKFFWSYINKGKEYWISVEKFNEYKLRQSTKEYKEKKAKQDLKYRSRSNELRRSKYKYDINYKNKVLFQSKENRRKNQKTRTVDQLASHANYERARREKFYKTPLILRAFCKIFYDTAKIFEEITGIKHHVDHIIPLSKGGRHTPWNLQVLTAEQNLQKSNLL